MIARNHPTSGNAVANRATRPAAAALLSVVTTTLLGACAVGPDFVRPAPPDVTSYTNEPLPESTVMADSAAQHFTPGAAVPADWWRLFKSAPLDSLVEQAIANSPTLAAS